MRAVKIPSAKLISAIVLLSLLRASQAAAQFQTRFRGLRTRSTRRSSSNSNNNSNRSRRKGSRLANNRQLRSPQPTAQPASAPAQPAPAATPTGSGQGGGAHRRRLPTRPARGQLRPARLTPRNCPTFSESTLERPARTLRRLS